MGSDSDCEAPKEETEEEVWVFLEILFLPQKCGFYRIPKANKRIQAEEEEKKAAQKKQAKLECLHVCIAMVGRIVFLCYHMFLGLELS